MAKKLNPDLTFIKSPSEIPVVASPDQTGNFFYFDKSGLMKQSPIYGLLEDIGAVSSGFMGGISPSSPIPVDGWVKGIYVAESSGIYVNAGGITVDLNEGFTMLLFDGSAWSSLILPFESGILKEWKESDNGAAFPLVRIFEGFFYKLKEGASGTLQNPAQDKNNWEILGQASPSTSDQNLYIISDDNIKMILGLNNTGKLNVFFENGAIPKEAVKGLDFIKFIEGTTPFYFTDSTGDFNINWGLEPGSIPKDAVRGLEVLSECEGVRPFYFADSTGKFDRDFGYENKSIPQEAVRGLEVIGFAEGDKMFKFTDSKGIFEIDYELKEKHIIQNDVIASEYFHLDGVNFLKIEMIGDLPEDISDARTPKTNILKFSHNNEVKFTCISDLSIQGHGSIFYQKKGYTVDLKNIDGKALKLKVNSDIEADSFHLKAFQTDITHTRDVGNSRFWRKVRNTKSLAEKPLSTGLKTSYNDKIMFVDDAKYYANGIPVSFFVNGKFHGLYTLRLKKTRENYALDNNNQNNIFLDSITYTANLGSKEYVDYDAVVTDFEIKSPKSPTTVTKNKIKRIFEWFRGVFLNTIDIRATAASYIDVTSFIDYLIISELVDNWDVNGNNINLITYDGNVWKIFIYDTDQSIGIQNGELKSEKTGLLLDFDIWTNFRTAFLPEIKLRYKELRDKNIISNETFIEVYGGISKNISRKVYSDNFKKWGSAQSNAIADMNQLYGFLENRKRQLDNIWL